MGRRTGRGIEFYVTYIYICNNIGEISYVRFESNLTWRLENKNQVLNHDN